MVDLVTIRLTELERRLAEQLQRRDQARAVLRQSEIAVHQLNGAIGVLRDLVAQNGKVDDVHGS